jgi:monofunctional biosynthetic peptidoglycan transglycosylase
MPLLMRLLISFVLVTLAWALLFAYVPVRLTPRIIQRSLQPDGKLPHGVQQSWAPLRAMSPAVPRSALAAQDPAFFQHWGFEWAGAGRRALAADSLRRLLDQGTITWQAAGQTFLWHSERPNWAHRLLNAYFTGLLELCWSKERILAVFLNTYEFQPGVFGVGAYAQLRLHQPLGALNQQQAAALWASGPPGSPGAAKQGAGYRSAILKSMKALPPARCAEQLPHLE